MENYKKHIFFFCVFFLSTSVFAATYTDRLDWKKYFKEAETQGVFVLYDLKHDRYQVSDHERADTAFIPASTFKIANSLIGLETHVITDENQVYPWDGRKREIEVWNQDHTLRTAIKYSVVPVYQEIARKIGAKRMQKYLHKLHYGNANIKGGIDRFWLDGELRISAMQQIQFLVRLYNNALPLSKHSQRIVKEIMLNESDQDYILRAKTGYAVRVDPSIGWWVGWVQGDDNTYFFALNLNVMQPNHLRQRIAISKAILRAENILP